MSKQKKIRRPVMIQGIRRWICGDTEQEYAENLIKAMQGSAPVVPPAEEKKHNFREYAQRWFEVFSKPSVEKVTAITYERQLRLHIYPVVGELSIEDITSADVQKIFNRMGDVARDTKNKTKMVLNMIFGQALEDDLIRKNPLKSKNVRVTGKNSQYTEPYTIDQMQFLVKNIGNIKNPQDRAYLALQALHPLSLEEVLGLQGDDIDGKHIYIKRAVTHPDRNQPIIKDTKETARTRRIDLVQQIASYLPETAPDEFIIGGKNPLSYTQVRRMCERIQKEIGFEDKITPIRFRTTVLTDMYDQTKDVKQTQAAAGHAKPTMTMERYARGRMGDFNSASPIASAYGLAN